MNELTLLDAVTNEAAVRMGVNPKDVLIDSIVEFGYIHDNDATMSDLAMVIVHDNIGLAVVHYIQEKASILKC